MQKLLIAAAVITRLMIPAEAGEPDAWSSRAAEPAVGEIPPPRPGAVVRDTVGAAPVPVPGIGRVIDDRVIVEERAPSVTPPPCVGGATRTACAR